MIKDVCVFIHAYTVDEGYQSMHKHTGAVYITCVCIHEYTGMFPLCYVQAAQQSSIHVVPPQTMHLHIVDIIRSLEHTYYLQRGEST